MRYSTKSGSQLIAGTILAACLFCGCAGTGTRERNLFFPPEQTPTGVDVSESDFLVEYFVSQGGIVGIAGIALGAALGTWRRKKELAARAALNAMTDGAASIAEQLSSIKNSNGLSFTTCSQSDAIKILQEAAGTDEALKARLDQLISGKRT